MTPSEVGERAEAAVLAVLARAQKHVLLPFGGQRRYDLAYEDDGQLVKVQCKTGREVNGAIVFRTCSEIYGKARDYTGDIDLFGVYCHDRDEVYLVPVDDVPPRGAHLRLRPALNGQRARIRDAAQYVVKDGLLPVALRAGHPERSSRAHSGLDRQMSIFGCSLASTNVDEGAHVTIPLMVAENELPVACCSPLGAPGLDNDAAAATATLFKALGDPQRIRLVNLLTNAGEAVCVCDITEALGLSQSTVSFHLKKLSNAGLLHREQRGTWAYYSIDRAAMKTLEAVVSTKGRTP